MHRKMQVLSRFLRLAMVAFSLQPVLGALDAPTSLNRPVPSRLQLNPSAKAATTPFFWLLGSDFVDNPPFRGHRELGVQKGHQRLAATGQRIFTVVFGGKT
jgi:hypothetical protein